MRNKTKTLFIGGAFACIGSLSGHGETFQQKLDAYFVEHAQEIQKSIQAWDEYNLHKPEYRITEQELKDIPFDACVRATTENAKRFFGF